MVRRWIKRGLWALCLLVALSGLAVLYVYAYREEAEAYAEDFVDGPLRQSVASYYEGYMAYQVKSSVARYGQKRPPIDEVKLVRFARERSNKSQRRLVVPLSKNSEGYVVSEKLISGVDAQRLATLWRGLTFVQNHTMCYDPHHVVEFRFKGKVICEAVICFHCMNSSLPAFPTPVLVNTFDMRQLKEGKTPDGGIYAEFKAMVEAEVGAAP